MWLSRKSGLAFSAWNITSILVHWVFQISADSHYCGLKIHYFFMCIVPDWKSAPSAKATLLTNVDRWTITLHDSQYMIVWSSIKSVKWDISSLEIGNTDIVKCMEVGVLYKQSIPSLGNKCLLNMFSGGMGNQVMDRAVQSVNCWTSLLFDLLGSVTCFAGNLKAKVARQNWNAEGVHW